MYNFNNLLFKICGEFNYFHISFIDHVISHVFDSYRDIVVFICGFILEIVSL